MGLKTHEKEVTQNEHMKVKNKTNKKIRAHLVTNFKH